MRFLYLLKVFNYSKYVSVDSKIFIENWSINLNFLDLVKIA